MDLFEAKHWRSGNEATPKNKQSGEVAVCSESHVRTPDPVCRIRFILP